MRKLSLLMMAVISVFVAGAQKGTLKARIQSSQQAPVENATAEIIKLKDSAVVRSGISDKAGLVDIDNIKYGNYLLRVSTVNSETFFSSPFELSETETSVSL